MKADFLLVFGNVFLLEWASPMLEGFKMASSDSFTSTNTPNQTITYSREMLIRLATNSRKISCPALPDFVPQNISCPAECQTNATANRGLLPAPSWTTRSRDVNKQRTHKRGQRGGVQIRLRKTKNTLPLPSILLANVRSFGRNKGNDNLDILHANVQYLSEYRNANLLCFTETWWCDETPKEYTKLDGFGYPFRQDRDPSISKKKTGGGVCIYVNERWCRKNAVLVRESVCTESMEALTLSFRPHYLPREFGQIFVTVVYVPPWASQKCMENIRNIVDKIQNISPSAPHFILGDFNQFDLKSEVPTLLQYVSIKTRKDSVIDKCYGNIQDAYRSIQKAPIGSSDHNAIYLVPKYVTKLKKESVQVRKVKVWNDESVEKMKACLETTDWDVLNAGEDVSENADVLASYILFCENTSVHYKTMKVFPNTKPWMDPTLKKMILDKNRLFAEGRKVEGKIADKEIKKTIRQNRLKNKEKVEKEYFSGDLRKAYSGIKSLVGKEEVRDKGDGMTEEERKTFVEDLNTFYCRFDSQDFSKERGERCKELEERVEGWEVPKVTVEEVEKVFKRFNVHKVCGPDQISGKSLKPSAKSLLPYIHRDNTTSAKSPSYFLSVRLE